MQYKAFHDGFYRVCGGIVLKLFQPMELMALVTGNENYNWGELEKNTEYKVLIMFDIVKTFLYFTYQYHLNIRRALRESHPSAIISQTP